MYSNKNINYEDTNNPSSVYLQHKIKDQQFLDIKEQGIQPHSLLFFKRAQTYSIRPIQSDGEGEDDGYNKHFLTSQSSTTNHLPFLRKAIKKQSLIKSIKKSGRACKDIIKSKKRKGSNIQNQSISWDQYDLKDLSKEIRRINRQYKSRNYEQIRKFFVDQIERKTKKHIISINGEKSTAKKSILFDFLSDSEVEGRFDPCFISFEDELNNSFDEKIKKFYNFLQNQAPKRNIAQSPIKLYEAQNINFEQIQLENRIHNKSSLEDTNAKIQQQKLAHDPTTKPKKIVIIDRYQNFIEGIRQKLLYNKFRDLLKQNIDIIFVFIGNSVSFIDKKMLEELKAEFCYFETNSKAYLLESILSFFQQNSFSSCKWILQRPLANFLCTKLEQKSILKLSIIKKFIKFLQSSVKEINSEPTERKITRQIIDRFLLTLGTIKVKIDLQKLPFHEKAFLLAIYQFLKENQQLLIPFLQVKRHYLWICSSFSINSKTDKQLFNETIYQLETYQLIDIKKDGKNNSIFLKINKQSIRNAFQQQQMFSRFFPQQQHSESE